MNFIGMGPMEILVIMVVALIIFGPGRLPEIGAQAGRALRDFKRATDDLTSEFQESIDDMQSTMGELRGTVLDVQRETEELARMVPDQLDLSGVMQPGAAQAASITADAAGAGASDSSAAVAIAAPGTNTLPAADEPVRAPTKADPLADFGE